MKKPLLKSTLIAIAFKLVILVFIIAFGGIIYFTLKFWTRGFSDEINLLLIIDSIFFFIAPGGVVLFLLFFAIEDLFDYKLRNCLRALFNYHTIQKINTFVSELKENEAQTKVKCKMICKGYSPSYKEQSELNNCLKNIAWDYKDNFLPTLYKALEKSSKHNLRKDINTFKFILKHKIEILQEQQQAINKCIESAYIDSHKESSKCRGLHYKWDESMIGKRELQLNSHENISIDLYCKFFRRTFNVIPYKWKDYFKQNVKDFLAFDREVIDFKDKKYREHDLFEIFEVITESANPVVSLVSFKTNLYFFQKNLTKIGLVEQSDQIWIRSEEGANRLVFNHFIIFEEASIDEVREFVFTKLHIEKQPVDHCFTILILFLKTSMEEMGIIIEKKYNAEKKQEEQRLLEEKRQQEERERLQREKEEELRRKEDERRKKEEEIRLAQEEHKKFVARIHHAVSNWHDDRGFPYNAHIPYFPNKTLHTFIQQDAQELVLDFKNGDSDIQEIYIEQLTLLLKKTFKDDLARLTFVCIPASNEEDNEFRYEFFSSAICENTGMTNAYGHIKIVESATSKHLGGTSAQLIFDSDFFNGKYVILFDDIITTGKTVLKMKQELEHFGADVICAISFGITTQDSYYSDEKLKPLLKKYER